MEREEGLVKEPLLVQRYNDAISINNGDNSGGGSGGGGDDDAHPKATSSATALLVLSTIVAASGSFSYGYAGGFSSPAETGIMAELGLSVAEVSATGTCLGTFLIGLSFFLQDLNWWKEMTPILALIGVLVYMGTFSLGMGGIPWIIVSEIFPVNVKGSAGSICNSVNWFCSWVVSYTFNFLLEWSSAGTFFIFSSISCFGVLFIAKLVPETKGRTLEEIQASMTHGVR